MIMGHILVFPEICCPRITGQALIERAASVPELEQLLLVGYAGVVRKIRPWGGNERGLTKLVSPKIVSGGTCERPHRTPSPRLEA